MTLFIAFILLFNIDAPWYMYVVAIFIWVLRTWYYNRQFNGIKY